MARVAFKFAIFIVAVFLAVSFSGHETQAQPPAQSTTRTVSGIVLNATKDGASESGQPITLHRVGNAILDDLTATTDASGRFRFEFDYDSALEYGVSVRYQNTVYGTDIDLSSGSPAPVTLTVYESSSDDSIVSAGAVSLLLASVDETAQTVAALEIVELVNESNLAYVPGSGVMELLRFGLPPGATDLNLDTGLIGADFVQVDRGFALLASVPPGEHEIMFSYEFPYDTQKFSLSKSYRYGAETARILTPEEVMEISGEALGAPESVIIGERPYWVIEMNGLAREESIVLDLDKLPTATLVDKIGNRFSGIEFQFAAPVALGLLMTSLLVYGSIRRRDSRRRRTAGVSTNTTPSADTVSGTEERAVLRAMINELTQSHRAGELNEADYTQRLRILNARLAELGD